MKLHGIRHGIQPAAIAAGLVAGLLCSAPGIATETGQGGSALSIECVDGQVALLARDVALQEVLAAIARECGLQLTLPASLDAQVSLSLQAMPLARALMRLLRHHSYLLQLSARSEGAGAPGRGTSGVLRVFPDDSIGTTEYRYVNVEDDRAEDALLLALESGDRDARVEAIHELAAIGGDDVVARLAAAAGDDDARIREEANNALGGIGGDQAIGQLEKSLRDADRDVREAAILALAEIGGEETLPALAVALQDPERSLRLEVVESLAEIGGTAAMHLLDLAQQDPDGAIRRAAADVREELLAVALTPAPSSGLTPGSARD